MEFRRAVRILAARWWLVVLCAGLGAAAALAFADYHDDRIEPRFEALAPITLLGSNDRDTATFENQLKQAENNARSVLSQTLTNPSFRIESDLETGQLHFVATSDNSDDAAAQARAMREAFYATEPSSTQAEQLQDQLGSIEDSIVETRAQIAEVTQTTPPDARVEAERALLDAKISALRQRAASLTIQIAFPDLAEAEAAQLEIELESVETLLDQLSEGLAELSTVTTDPDFRVNLDLLVLQQRVRQFEDQYVTLALRLLEDQVNESNTDELLITTDLTPEPIGATRAGAVGLGAGILVSILALVILDNLRKPLLALDDVRSTKQLAAVPRSRPGARNRPWYPTAGSTRRRRQVQVVRTAVEAAIRPPATVGLVGLEASDNDVQAFAADLAAALAVAGRQVLLIDANTQRPARYVEFDNESPRFADIVGSSFAAIEDTQAIMKAALNDRTEVVPGLRSLAAGKNVGDPVDNLAGRSFLTLLDVARDLADVTIFATPAFGEPTTEVMTHRLDFMVVVARIRATTTRQLEHAVESMAGRSADVLGVVLLHGKKSLTGRSPKAIRPSSQRGNRREKRHTRKPPPSGPVPSSPSDHPHKRGEPEEPAGHDATEDPTGPPAGIQTPAAVASDNTAGPGAAPDLVARSGASSIKPSSDAAETKKPRAGKRARRKIQSSPTESIESGSGKHRSPQARAAATRRPAAVASREDPTDNAELSEPKESPAPVGERQKQPSGPAGSDLAGDASSLRRRPVPTKPGPHARGDGHRHPTETRFRQIPLLWSRQPSHSCPL